MTSQCVERNSNKVCNNLHRGIRGNQEVDKQAECNIDLSKRLGDN